MDPDVGLEAERKASEESNRAQLAEGEVQKYKIGKASQDGRIKGYLEETDLMVS